MSLSNLYNQEPETTNGIPVQAIDIDRDHETDSDGYLGRYLSEPSSVSNGNDGNVNSPLTGLQQWIENIARSGVDENRVRQIVDERIARVKPKRIEVKTGEVVNPVQGSTHFQFELVIKAISSGVNLALTGPGATGKTTLAIQCAEALGIPYMVFKPLQSMTEATGYMDAHGNFVPSNLYRAQKAEKMLCIFDEFDASDPQAALVCNSIFENKRFTYPSGETVYSPNLQVVVTMNTRGTGSDRKYVGRNRLDAATMDRFCLLEIEPDLSLEAALIGVIEPQRSIRIGEGTSPSPEEWLEQVREARAAYKVRHPDRLISMRAVRDGWKLIQAGIGSKWALSMAVDK